MKHTFRKLLLLGLASASCAIANAATIFSENMGTPSGTTTIANNAFQNEPLLSFSGTGDVRTTTASSGYTGSSGSGNIFLTNTGNPSFVISGINTTGYAAGSLDITFGAYKSTTASNMSELTLEYSTNGTSFSALTIPTQATGSGTANWRLVTVDGATIPSSSNLYLRWTNSSTGPQFRIDDITLIGTAIPEPSSFAALAGIAVLGAVTLRRRSR